MKTIKGIYYFDTYKEAKEFAMTHNWPTKFIRSYQRGCAIQRGISSCYLGPDNLHIPVSDVLTWAEIKSTAMHTH
jgi:hypothetical protein